MEEGKGSQNEEKIKISVSDPNPDWIRIQSGQWIRIQEGKNDPQKLKKKKLTNFSVLKCWMFSFEG
jgi:hypothetical protein